MDCMLPAQCTHESKAVCPSCFLDRTKRNSRVIGPATSDARPSALYCSPIDDAAPDRATCKTGGFREDLVKARKKESSPLTANRTRFPARNRRDRRQQERLAWTEFTSPEDLPPARSTQADGLADITRIEQSETEVEHASRLASLRDLHRLEDDHIAAARCLHLQEVGVFFPSTLARMRGNFALIDLYEAEEAQVEAETTSRSRTEIAMLVRP
jgi:hypothetical protein